MGRCSDFMLNTQSSLKEPKGAQSSFFFLEIEKNTTQATANHRRLSMIKDEEGSQTRVTKDKLEKFKLNFSRCTNRDVAPMVKFPVFLC